MIRVKGSSFSFFLYANNGTQVRPLVSNATVHPGERIGFRVENKKKGFLAIVGLDELGNDYVCFPQRDREAKFISSGKERTLDQAIKLDNKLGRERIIALFCDQPFSVEELGRRIIRHAQTYHNEPLPLLFSGCEQREVILEEK